MTDLEEKARQAITYTLRRIRDDDRIWYHMGFGTQVFSLLTEACAALEGRPIEDVREEYISRESEGGAS